MLNFREEVFMYSSIRSIHAVHRVLLQVCENNVICVLVHHGVDVPHVMLVLAKGRQEL